MATTEKVVTRLHTSHIPPFGLRLQQDLKDALEQAAKAQGRSLNAEIVNRLQKSMSLTDTDMDQAAVRAVEALATEHGIPFARALSMLVLAGASEDASLIYVNLASTSGKAKEFSEALSQAVSMQPDADLHIHMEPEREIAKSNEFGDTSHPHQAAQIGAYITNYTGSGVIVIRQGGKTSNID